MSEAQIVARTNRRAKSWGQRVRVLAASGLAALALAGVAQANLIVNGGFESTDLSGWSTSNNFTFSGVECAGQPDAFEGNCNLFAGPVGLPGTLSQTFSTVAGQRYVVSFALEVDDTLPNNFSAVFGGTTLLTLSNAAASPYLVRTMLATASSASSTLAFTFRSDINLFRLDAVSVNAASVPEPAPLGLLAIALGGLWFGRSRRR